MKLNVFSVMSFLICFLVAVPPIVSASDDTEVFVVALDSRGYSSYMESAGDGQFLPQELIGRVSGYSYGNGMGDFDNDGDLDLIMGIGLGSGEIYLFEKLGPGNNFAAPRQVGVWSEGHLPVDIAVADFNEDGNLDFVLPQYESINCELYFGDGQLGFTPSVIPDSIPEFSVGADAADFNNDGHSDFIAAPYRSNQDDRYFYVNLGNGDGTFKTIEVKTYMPDPTGSSATYWGVAAGDFDGDGIADLVATSVGLYDIYLGVGDGTFDWGGRIYDGNISYYAPVDNYDFNGDQIQDIVIGRYGSRPGIGVLQGDGEGGFVHKNTYVGGSNYDRLAISAPPYIQNKSPVAVIDPAYQEVTVGKAVFLDGEGSYDEDGEIVSYAWDFGEQSAAKTQSSNTGFSGEHVYYQAGLYTVTLIVTDDKGATASVQAEVRVKPLEVRVRFTPRTLNPKSKGKWVKAAIRVPRGYDASQIDPNSVSIVEDGKTLVRANADGKWNKFSKRFKRKRVKREAKIKFDRQELLTALSASPSGKKILVVEGLLSHNGGSISFEGSGAILKSEPRLKQKPDKKDKGDKEYKRPKKSNKLIKKFKKFLYTWLKHKR